MRTDAPNTLLLHRYHHGELDGDDREHVRLAIEQDAETRRRFQAIVAAESDFAVQPLPAFLGDLQAPAPPWWRWWLPVAAPVGLLAAAAAAVMLTVGVPGTAPEPDTAPYIGIKGALPDLEVWLAADAGPRPLRPEESVGEGDTIQLAFDGHGARYVTLAGRDGTGEIEIYRTLDVGDAAGLITAPFALTLDDAPGPQRFYVLAHDGPLSDDDVRDAVQNGTGDLRTVTLPKR